MTDSPVSVTFEQISQWQWADLAPARLQLDGRQVSLEPPLRFLPGRRLVAFSDSHPDSVFKCFFGDRGKRDYRRERDNLLRLSAAGLPVPALIGGDETPAGAWLELQRIRHGQSLYHCIDQPQVQTRYLAVLEQLYRAGFVQTDPHWDNFLFDDKQLWLVDAGAVQISRSVAEQQANAGLVLAQCDATRTALEASLLVQLASILSIPPARLEQTAQQQRRQRIRRFISKTRRSSTRIVALCHGHANGWRLRALSPADTQMLLAAIDAGPDEQALKNGRSATVYVSGAYVIKRYNCRSFWQRLKRRLGRDRALNAWTMGLTFAHFGISTPEPVMYLARADGTRFLVTRLITDADELQMRLAQQPGDRRALAQCQGLLDALHGFGFWHGDAKARNFLLRAEQAWVIDLDAAGWSASARRAARHAARDQRRFDRNGARP